jgi:hypothetical protein
MFGIRFANFALGPARRERRRRRGAARRGPLVLEGLEARNLLSFAAPSAALLPGPATNPGLLSVAAADFTGDGKLDLAVVSDEGGNTRLSVFPGNGDGSFQAARTVPIPPRDGPELAAGDFTGRGTPDLAVSSLTGIDILLGNGDGTFRFGGSFEILPGGAGQAFAGSISVGGFFGDGKQDLVVTDEFGDVALLRGNGDGTFQPGVAVGTFNPSGFFAAVAGDVNNDGKQDLIVATAGRTLLLAGNGDGTFQSPVPFAPGFPLAVADANGDGIPDLVFATPSGISERLGNGDGTFQDPVAVNFPAGTPGTVIGVGDFTNDGRLDAVLDTTSSPVGVLNTGAVGVLLNNGDGTFATAPAYATGPFPREVVAGDFTGSGRPDLVTADSGGTHLLPNNGDGTFASPITVAGFLGGLIPGDFNGDGHLDLAALSRSSAGLQVQVFLGNGDRTFQAPRTTDVGSSDFIPEQVVAGDLDGDGKLDLAVMYEDIGPGRGQSFVTVLLGNGDGTFRVTDTHQVAPRSDVILASGLAAADFTGDGHLDLVETNSDGTVNLLLGNGDGTFQAPVSYKVGTGAGAVLAGDFNGDRIPDIAVISAGNTVSVLRGNGDGTFQDPVSYLAGDTPVSLVAADFNGDGALDLATANHGSASVTVLLNRNDGPGGAPSRAPAGLSQVARPAAVAALSAGTRAEPARVVVGQPPAAAAVDAALAAGRPAALVPPPAPPALAGAGALAHRHKGDWAVAADAAGLADPLVNDL